MIMSPFWKAFTELYLMKIKGYYRLRLACARLGKTSIPGEIYRSSRKLNLGASYRKLPTYINVDVLEKFNPDVVCDVRKLDFAPDGSYDLVRVSHILEHFEYGECRTVLNEWRRVLRPGGYLVICVPDHEAEAWRTILKPSGYGLESGSYGNGWINGLYALDLPPEFRHKIVFTRKSLEKLLESCGFRIVSGLDYMKEEPFTLGITDDSCTLFSLNIAAVKV